VSQGVFDSVQPAFTEGGHRRNFGCCIYPFRAA
jgi:hypothetical protein